MFPVIGLIEKGINQAVKTGAHVTCSLMDGGDLIATCVGTLR